MATTQERIRVEFIGDSSGASRMIWGQHYSWNIITATGVPMCVGGVQDAPPGRTAADIAEVLRFVMNRHEVLRTRFVPGPDGVPYQVLEVAGEIYLDVVEAHNDDPVVVAAVYDRYSRPTFDHAHEWPVRMGVVQCKGALTHVVVAYSHLAMDGAALQAMMRDVIANLGSPQPPPVTVCLREMETVVMTPARGIGSPAQWQ